MAKRIDTAQFIERAIAKHGEFYDYSATQYVEMYSPVSIRCPLHGEWKVTANAHLYQRKRGLGCPGCGAVKLTGEEKMSMLFGHIPCRDCGNLFPATEEHFPKRGLFLRRQCRGCLAEKEGKRRVEKADEIREFDRVRNAGVRQAKNKARLKAQYHAQKADPEWLEAERARNREKAKRFPGTCRAYVARRRARKMRATPPWLTTEQHEAINAIYREAAHMTKATGIKHHVDHIVPLDGKIACGLHVAWNLRIVTADENWRKGNRLLEVV